MVREEMVREELERDRNNRQQHEMRMMMRYRMELQMINVNLGTCLYDLNCRGEQVRVTVTRRHEVVGDWVRMIRYQYTRNISAGDLVAGVAVQFVRRRNMFAASFAVCIGNQCLLFQLRCAFGRCIPLQRFMASTGVIFVCDIEKPKLESLLRKSWHRIEVARSVDIREEARRHDRVLGIGPRHQLSYVTAFKNLLNRNYGGGRNMVGPDWEHVNLSSNQVLCACGRALINYKLGMEIYGDEE